MTRLPSRPEATLSTSVSGSDRLLCAMSTPMHGMMTPAGKPGRFMYSQKITPQTRNSPY